MLLRPPYFFGGGRRASCGSGCKPNAAAGAESEEVLLRSCRTMGPAPACSTSEDNPWSPAEKPLLASGLFSAAAWSVERRRESTAGASASLLRPPPDPRAPPSESEPAESVRGLRTRFSPRARRDAVSD